MKSLILLACQKLSSLLKMSIPVLVALVMLASLFYNYFQYNRVQSMTESNVLLNEQMLKLSDEKTKLEGQVLMIQGQQRAVAELDEKYTKELSDAQDKINQLESDVRDGNKRVQLNARCPDSQSSGTSTTTAASMDNAATARLTEAARQDYFRLRQDIERTAAQVAGLQDYIKNVCLAESH